jgi:hypothetical protein
VRWNIPVANWKELTNIKKHKHPSTKFGGGGSKERKAPGMYSSGSVMYCGP